MRGGEEGRDARGGRRLKRVSEDKYFGEEWQGKGKPERQPWAWRMGNCFSPSQPRKFEERNSKKGSAFYAIPDQYQSLEEVTQALRLAGLESSNLILGIDFTISNTETGCCVG